MRGRILDTGSCLILTVLVVTGCTLLRTQTADYRVETAPCELKAKKYWEEGICGKHSLQWHQSGPRNAQETWDQVASHLGPGFTLGIIEFDDQGLAYRRQMNSVLSNINKLERDMLMVVYMHGWHHSAKPGDRDIRKFRRFLMALSKSENKVTESAENYLSEVLNEDRDTNPREVVGVYLGWRGESLWVPYLNTITFWNRKDVAQRVGQGGVTEVLARLERIIQWKDRDQTCIKNKQEPGDEQECPRRNRNKLIVIGHSFGGAAVYGALSQILESRFVRTSGWTPHSQDASVESSVIEGFGDLVVLVNPAFEALQFASLSDISTEHHRYSPYQLPVLAVLTSEGDWYTKKLFSYGRIVSTLFEEEGATSRKNPNLKEERYETIVQRDANITALGHFELYRTHRLLVYKPDESSSNEQVATELDAQVPPKRIIKTGTCWRNDRTGSTIPFGNVVLKRTNRSAGRNPYLVVQVGGELIDNDTFTDDHNDVWDEDLTNFVKNLVLISSQTDDQAEVIELKDIISGPCEVSVPH